MLIFLNENGEDGSQNLLVKNIGYGPAIDIVFDWPQTGEEMQPYHGTDPYRGPVRLGSLGARDIISTSVISKSKIPITENDRLSAVLEYNDFLGNCYKITYEKRQHSEPILLEQRKTPFEKVLKI
ncbi:MAG: hypothetical protein HY268_07270 [Deltaproteobacteria bacterium]|nr:hypothetical protein [Deltaproteobacteria bacterium]